MTPPKDITTRGWAENLATVKRHKKSAVQFYEALREIRDGRQYLDGGFPTFESFCENVLGCTRQHATRLMKAGGSLVEMEHNVPDLTNLARPNDRQAAELAAVTDPAERAELWKEHTRQADESGERITAAKVRETVEQLERDKPGSTTRTKPPEFTAASSMVVHVRALKDNPSGFAREFFTELGREYVVEVIDVWAALLAEAD